MFNLIKSYLNKKLLTSNEAGSPIMGVRDQLNSNPGTNLTPVKLARILRDSGEGDILELMELAEEIEEKDLQYQTVLSTRKRTVAQLDISVEPADDTPAAKMQADFVKSFLNRDTLESEIFDMLDAVGKGFSVTEIIWETSSSQWMPKSLNWVDPRWITFRQNDLSRPLLKVEGGYKELTPFKYIYTTIKAKSGLDIRGGLIRGITWAYLFKNFSLKNWVSFLEVYGHPFRVGKYGRNATDKDKRNLLRAVLNLGADAAAIVPQDMLIEFIKNETGSGGAAFKDHASYFDQAISKAVLGQTTTTDAISGGHAVSQEHNEVRMDIANSDARQLAAVLNRDLIRPMIDLNFGQQKAYPKLHIGNPETEDTSKLTESVARLMPYGFTVSAKQLRSKLGLNAPEDADDVFGQSGGFSQLPAFNQALNKPLKPVNRDFIDDLGDDELKEWQPKVEPVKKKIEELIARLLDEGKSLEDLEKELTKLEVSPDELAQSLAKNSMAAYLTGLKDVE
ncbi:MAG: DUF935 domain-containing protein [Proteobacteria bacterium]|nr:DUF935 domain-containing protein [Pseudomonadota bacterium]